MDDKHPNDIVFRGHIRAEYDDQGRVTKETLDAAEKRMREIIEDVIDDMRARLAPIKTKPGMNVVGAFRVEVHMAGPPPKKEG